MFGAGMMVISWMLAIVMWIGYGLIKRCEEYSKNPESEEELKIGADYLIQDYNSKDWFGRVMFVIYFGFVVIAQGFNIKRRD